MLNMPSEDISAKIQEQKGLTAAQVKDKVAEKMRQLSGLISEEGAYHIVANELGVSLVPDAANSKAADLVPGMRDVEIALRAVQVYELREFARKDGASGKVKSFLGGDASGVIRVTCWDARADDVVNLQPQDVVRIKNAYTKDNNGRVELHTNANSTIEINPEGVSVEGAAARTDTPQGPTERKKIADLSRGDYRVELMGTIVQVYDPRFFDRKDGTRAAVVNMMLDDGSGSIRAACWAEVAAKLLGTTEEELLAREGETFEEERTERLGNIITARGRVKLNTMYNTLEMNVDELDLQPDPNAEIKRLGGGAQETLAEKPAPTPAATKALADESIEDLDDLADLDDL